MTSSSAIDIDALLQDSYLLGIQLHQGDPVEQGQVLWQHCTTEIERVEQALRQANMSQSAIDHIRYAQCALLDETVLGRVPDDAYAAWHAKPLQTHFFQTLQAGEELYNRMRDVLREPAPDSAVLTCFHRVLMFGFKGRYSEQSPERLSLIKALSERVVPLNTTAIPASLIKPNTAKYTHWRHSRIVHLLAVGLLIAGIWWGLHAGLVASIATLLPQQL